MGWNSADEWNRARDSRSDLARGNLLTTSLRLDQGPWDGYIGGADTGGVTPCGGPLGGAVSDWGRNRVFWGFWPGDPKRGGFLGGVENGGSKKSILGVDSQSRSQAIYTVFNSAFFLQKTRPPIFCKNLRFLQKNPIQQNASRFRRVFCPFSGDVGSGRNRVLFSPPGQSDQSS